MTIFKRLSVEGRKLVYFSINFRLRMVELFLILKGSKKLFNNFTGKSFKTKVSKYNELLNRKRILFVRW